MTSFKLLSLRVMNYLDAQVFNELKSILYIQRIAIRLCGVGCEPVTPATSHKIKCDYSVPPGEAQCLSQAIKVTPISG